MNPISPLQLRDYQIESLHLDANPHFALRSGEQEAVALSFDFDFKKKDDAPLFRIGLEVSVNQPDDAFKNGRYRIRARTNTFVEFDPSTPRSEIDKLLGPNGLAMAYAIIRGIVGQATGTALHGKFILPTVNFVELLRSKAQEMKKPPKRKREARKAR